MCGRYSVLNPSEIYSRFDVKKGMGDTLDNFPKTHNLTPGMSGPVVIKRNEREAYLMRWGLVPSWAKDTKMGYKMINARADTLSTKPSFRSPFKKQRCLVPADGFYEWKGEENKIPYYFRMKDGSMFSFAGLYDIWKDPEGAELYTYTIITTEPNESVKSVHDRMPVVLSKEHEEDWLSESSSEDYLNSMLAPINYEFEFYPVTKDLKNRDYGML
jgi:putative SOS response-associated peptidase YedK